jgi:hypothetical protein
LSKRFTATVGTGLVIGAGTCDCVLEFDGDNGDRNSRREHVRVVGPGVFVAADPSAGSLTLLVKSST